MKLVKCLIWLLLVPIPAFGQAPDAIIRVTASPTRLAVSDFVSRVSASQETLSALTVFNQVLFDDLKFSAFFEIPSKSFYPLKPLRVPQDVVFENWQVPSLDADYLAFGSVYPSRIKPDAVRAELDLLRQARTLLDLPLVAIGGITADNAAPLIDMGIDAVAVITDVIASEDPFEAAQRFSALFRKRDK